jgi:hypothetical protein
METRRHIIWAFLVLAFHPLACEAAPRTPIEVRVSSDLPHEDKIQILNTKFNELALRDPEKENLAVYTRSHYARINPALRNVDPVVLTERARSICGLDASTSGLLIHGFTLFRGHSYLPVGADHVGYIFSDRAFVSSSLSRFAASAFAGMQSPQVLDIIEIEDAPVQGIWMMPIALFPDEEEFLISRNTQFEVMSVTREMRASGEWITRRLKPLVRRPTPETDALLNCEGLAPL